MFKLILSRFAMLRPDCVLDRLESPIHRFLPINYKTELLFHLSPKSMPLTLRKLTKLKNLVRINDSKNQIRSIYF